MSCSGTGVPPVSDSDASLRHPCGSMTVLAACLPRRSGTKAGVVECASPLALFFLTCSSLRNGVLSSQAETGAHASRVPCSAPPPNTSIRLARLGKPKQGYARVFQKKIFYVSPLKTPAFKLIQSHSRLFKPLPPRVYKKMAKYDPVKTINH